MSLLLDTSAYSALQRGNRAIKQLLESADQVYVPLIVVGELKAGFAFGTKQQQNLQYLDKFMADPTVSAINIDDKTTDVFAVIYADLRKSGYQIGQNDLWIAALAVENGLPLLTMDADFQYVAGLELVKV